MHLLIITAGFNKKTAYSPALFQLSPIPALNDQLLAFIAGDREKLE